jgi:predicted ribosome quality control (RQC) complex YloA/Tae2 family protein
MPFDALTIAAVHQELRDIIIGGRVQNLLMPGPLALSLEIYRSGTGRSHLLLSAHPQHARIHLTPVAPSRDPEQHPPLLLLLRKYVRGGTLLDMWQPRHERILGLSIAKRFYPDKHQEYHSEGDFRHTGDEAEEEPDAPLVTVQLIVEVMGRVSNIVLVGEDGVILDSIKRIPPSLNRYRTTLPHQPYVEPPPQEKRDPMHASINAVSLELARAAEEDRGAAAWKGLVSGFSGVSPALAREAVFRALGDPTLAAEQVAPQPAMLTRLLNELQTLFSLEETGGWEPTLAWREKGEGERQPVDFAPYRLTHLERGGATLEPCASVSEAASKYFAGVQSLGGHSALKSQVRAEIEEIKKRDERKLFALREEWTRAQALEELRRKGEFLLAYMHTLEPGQRKLDIPGEKLTIDLDPNLTPVENAQALFRAYRKAQSAHEGLPEKIAGAEIQLRFAEELLTSLDLAASHDEIRAVQNELRLARASAGQSQQAGNDNKQRQAKSKGRKPQDKTPQPLRLRTRYGAHVLVGRTASQNEIATFRLAAPEDLWFHAQNVPGGHVILRTEPGVTEQDIQEAASLAAAYSKLRAEAHVDVVYTERKYVRRVPNAPPGFATYKNERVVRVAPSKLAAKWQPGDAPV